MRIVRILMALAFAALAALAGLGSAYVVKGARAAPRLTVSYEWSAAADGVEVRMRVPDWTPGLRFGWAGNEAKLGVEDVRMLASGGKLLTPSSRVEPAGNTTRRWYGLDGHEASVEIRYRIRPPPIEDGPRGTPSRVGCVQATRVALLPEQLYLHFEGAVARPEVTTRLPADWTTIAPGTLASEEGGTERSPWIAGRFEVEEVEGTAWQLAWERSLATELVERLRTDVEAVREVARVHLPGVEQARTRFVFGALPADGILAGTLDFAELLYLDVSAHHPRVRAEIARRAVASFAASRPATEQWFGLALGEWLADRCCTDLSGPGILENRLRAYERHGDEIDAAEVGESRYSGDYWREAWASKSAAVLFALESMLGSARVPGGLEALARAWAEGESLTRALGERVGPAALARVGEYLRHGGFPLARRAPIRFEDAPALGSGAPPSARAVLRLACSGSGEGRLESCACTGAVTGGIPRRASVIAEAKRAQAIPERIPIAIELGDFLTHQTPSVLDDIQAREQRLYAELLASIPSDVVVVGQGELLRGPEWFRAIVEGAALPTVSANIRASGARVAAASRIVRRGSMSVAFVGWSDPWMEERDYRSFGAEMRGVEVREDVEELREVLTPLSTECDLTVVAGRIGPHSLEAMLARFGAEIDVVVTLDPTVVLGAPVEQRHLTGGFVGRTLVLVHPRRDNGVSLFDVEVGRHQALSWTVEGRLLDGSVAEDPAVSARLDRFYASLGAVAGDHARRLFTGDPWVADDFVDEAVCAECHDEPTLQWQTTRHAKAFDTIVRAARQNHPDCVRCHVTGFGWDSGYRLTDPDRKMRNVGCQTCHGSGGRHVASPTGANIRRTPARETCAECHDAKHSPYFQAEFESYWRKVVHAAVAPSEARLSAASGEER